MKEMKEHLIGQVKNDKREMLVREIRNLTDTTYVISLDRNGLKFIPGQYMTLGLLQSKEMREYSVYSGSNDKNLEFLIKEIEDGDVSKQLRNIKAGDFITIDGPFGFFSIQERNKTVKKHLFIASGTGISPFHSYVKSYGNLNYKIIHGIKTADEAYDKNDYEKGRYISCTSKDNRGDFQGRVTEYLKKNPVDKETLCYICGNSNMIYDAFDILRNQGVLSSNVYMEVYF